MSPTLTFLFGLLLLGLFCWYFLSDKERVKRWLGTSLTVLLCAFCIDAFLPFSQKIRLGLDLQGGTSFLVRLVQQPAEEGQPPRAITPEMQEQAVEVIRKRVDQFGVSEPVITKQGNERILVQIPGLDTAQIQTAREQLQRVAKLEFRLVHPESDRLVPAILSGQAVTPPGYVILNSTEQRDGKPEKLLVKRRPELTGDMVARAFSQYAERGYQVALKFTGRGAELFRTVTRENINQRLAIVLDNEVVSAPNIVNEIPSGEAVITGSFTAEEVQNLASVLENPLETPVVIDEVRSVSATLGRDSIEKGVLAACAGLVATFFFVLLYYRWAGMVALFGLAVNGVLLFGIMAMFGFVLTLPGIAGIILTIGMAIDANVLIYERLREELALGKSIKTAVDTAYQKAFSAIFDSNVNTLIHSAVLFWLGSGPIKGFAVTLTIGVIASMFSALLVTRTLFGWLIAKNILKKISMLNLIRATNFDFLGKRWIAIWISVALFAICAVAAGVRGTSMFNIDFTGGDLLVLHSQKELTESDVRGQLSSIGLGEVTIQREVGQKDGKQVPLISIRSPFNSNQKIVDQLKSAYPDANIVVDQAEAVGPIVGSQLAITSLWALAIGTLGIFVYVMFRFELSFAVGVIFSVIYDVLLTLGLFILSGRDMSLIMVGAILTVSGYSLNDKIVVFDRIREYFHSGKKGSIQTLMNQAINETLSRTVLTAGVTLLSMIGLYFLGGEVLADFAFTIFFGILIGTFSSIFIASPIVLWWTRMRKRDLHEEVRAGEAERQRAQPRASRAIADSK